MTMAMGDPYLDFLLEFLRFPSVSAESRFAGDVARCADWLAGRLRDFGMDACAHPTARHPVVLAATPKREGRPTVLIYGHYDVQPPDPLGQWDSPPFEPSIRDGVIYARGATDNKGQIAAHIAGVASALREGIDLPCNVVFLIEGEEEIGSTNLEPFIGSNRDRLRCDVIAISDTGMIAPGVPALTYGTRGIAALEIRLTGPSTDLHSGIFGGTVMNPAMAAAKLAASLTDDRGRVAVAGFYDAVVPLGQWERDAWAKLPVGEAEILALTGSGELLGEEGFSPVERIWGRPTAEINGIGGGFQGEGSKTVIPREAFFKLTCRLVPDQQPETIERLVAEHLRARCPAGIQMEIATHHGGSPFLCDPSGPWGKAAQRALRRTFGKEPALTREGGTIPILETLKSRLGADILLLGLANPDCHAHAPNERFPVENFMAGIRLNRVLLEECSRPG